MEFQKFLLLYIFFIITILYRCYAPPVSPNKNQEHQDENYEMGNLEDLMEYHRYLKEVVNALESDPEFRKKLENADEKDIRSGKIAEDLEYVSHHVRSRLDEIKRVELERLRQLAEKKQMLMGNSIDIEDPNHGHLDHSNPHTFEIEDLKKLIAKTTQDLAEVDKIRKDNFKSYEMEKEYEKQVKLNKTNGSEREKLEKEFKELEDKHKNHEKLLEPGHKAQLEDVWEKQDQMQQEFDPKTFFMLHDLDGNGFWDHNEVKALFIRELEKMYSGGHPEDDMRERVEEMERMRESVFNEVDTNRDGIIDFQEFLAQTRKSDFEQDHGWQGLDEKKVYSDEELQEYIRRHEYSNGYPHQQYNYEQVRQAPPQYHPQQLQYHQGQIHQQPPQYQGQVNQPPPPQYQGQVNQPPPQYHHQGQMPQQAPHLQQGQPPQHYQQHIPQQPQNQDHLSNDIPNYVRVEEKQVVNNPNKSTYEKNQTVHNNLNANLNRNN